MRIPKAKAVVIFILLCLPTHGNAEEALLDQAYYAVFLEEWPLLEGSVLKDAEFCVTVESRDPTDYVLARLQSVFSKITIASNCESDAKFDLSLVGDYSRDTLRIRFGCMETCKYDTTYALSLSSGSWVVTGAQHRMM